MSRQGRGSSDSESKQIELEWASWKFLAKPIAVSHINMRLLLTESTRTLASLMLSKHALWLLPC